MKHYLLIVECAIECNGKFLIIQRPEGKHAGGLLAFAGGKVDEQDETSRFDILRAVENFNRSPDPMIRKCCVVERCSPERYSGFNLQYS